MPIPNEGEKDWEEVDWPVWISYRVYNDTWELGRYLQEKTGLKREQVPMNTKYTQFEVYYKITEDGEVKGPYDQEEGEMIR